MHLNTSADGLKVFSQNSISGLYAQLRISFSGAPVAGWYGFTNLLPRKSDIVV